MRSSSSLFSLPSLLAMKPGKIFYGWWVVTGLFVVAFFGIGGRSTVTALGGSALCVAVFVGSGLLVKDVRSLYIFCIVYGIAYAHFVITIPCMGDLFGRGYIGALTGYVMAPHGFLGSVGSILWSRIFEITGIYNLACLVSAGVYVLVVLGYILVRPIRTTTSEREVSLM